MPHKIAIFAVATVLMAGVTVASAQKNPNVGTPSDYNQGVERDVHGTPHGSINNPSPHGVIRRQGTPGYDAFGRADNSSVWRSPFSTGAGSPGYEPLLKTF